MVIKRMTIRNFGKLHDRTFELSPGINVIYGKNESGKTTMHTFIKSMFYGISRQKGRGAKNDVYSKYEPWENPADYGGTIWFESQGKNYRLTRNFYKGNQSFELLCEDDGEFLDARALESLLGEVSEAVYDNTVSIAQLKSVTAPSLAKEIQNYMASYQGAGDGSVDLGRAEQMLKMWRKGYQAQQEKHRKEIQKEQEKLSAKIEYLGQELNDLRGRRAQVSQKEEALQIKPGDDSTLEMIEDKQKSIQNKNLGVAAAVVIAIIVIIVAAVGRFQFADGMSRLGMDICLAIGAAVLFYALHAKRKLRAEMTRQKKLKARWLAQQEKLKWNRESLQESYEEKMTDLTNLQNEYHDYETETYLPTQEDTEIQALNLAMDTIQELSGNIHRKTGRKLRMRTSQILKEITQGRYQEVLMDQELHLAVNTPQRTIPVERLSRGTMEQVYFALRMAAGELMCGDTLLPIVLDDVFGMYDEPRLSSALRWLSGQPRQVIVGTCNGRETELLDKEEIAYQKILL